MPPTFCTENCADGPAVHIGGQGLEKPETHSVLEALEADLEQKFSGFSSSLPSRGDYPI